MVVALLYTGPSLSPFVSVNLPGSSTEFLANTVTLSNVVWCWLVFQPPPPLHDTIPFNLLSFSNPSFSMSLLLVTNQYICHGFIYMFDFFSNLILPLLWCRLLFYENATQSSHHSHSGSFSMIFHLVFTSLLFLLFLQDSSSGFLNLAQLYSDLCLPDCPISSSTCEIFPKKVWLSQSQFWYNEWVLGIHWCLKIHESCWKCIKDCNWFMFYWSICSHKTTPSIFFLLGFPGPISKIHASTATISLSQNFPLSFFPTCLYIALYEIKSLPKLNIVTHSFFYNPFQIFL